MDRPKEFDRQLLKALPRLKAHAIYLTRNSHDANDLLQDTMIRAMRGWQTFDCSTNIEAWLTTIMTHGRLNDMRYAFRRYETQFPVRPGTDVPIEFAHYAVEPNGDARVYLSEVCGALDKLMPHHKATLELDAMGYSYLEMAERTETKLGTIKSRLNRAHEALEKRLELV